MTLPTAPRKSPPTWSIHQKVLQNEPAFASPKRPSELAAGKLLIRQRLIRFDAHQLVLCAAVRALERCCFGDRHDVGGV